MSARYFTMVSDELLPELRSGDNMPPGLRLIGEIEHDNGGRTRVEFEDDGAPAELNGAEVEPVISGEYNQDGTIVRTWISDRRRIS